MKETESNLYLHIKPITELNGLNFMNESDILTDNINEFKQMRNNIVNKQGPRMIHLLGSCGINSLFISLCKSLPVHNYLIIKEKPSNPLDLIKEISKLIKLQFYDKTNKVSGELREFKEDYIILRTKEMESKFQIDSLIYSNLKRLNILKNDWIIIDLKSKDIQIIGTTKTEKVEPGKIFMEYDLKGEIMQHNLLVMETDLLEFYKYYYGKNLEVPVYNHHLINLIHNGKIKLIPPLILIENILNEEEKNILETFSRSIYSPYIFIKTINQPTSLEIKYLQFPTYNLKQKQDIIFMLLKDDLINTEIRNFLNSFLEKNSLKKTVFLINTLKSENNFNIKTLQESSSLNRHKYFFN